MTGFPAISQIPSYSGVKFKPDSKSKFPSFKGIDFQTGKQVDLADYFANPVYMAGDKKDELPTSSALPDIDPKIKSYLDLFRAMSPERIAEYEAMSNIASQQQLKQAYQLYPLLSQAGREATARSLAASQAYRAFAEQLPSNVQNIMASKQAQMQSAQAGEAALQQATADQLRAAKESQGRFAGQYVQFG